MLNFFKKLLFIFIFNTSLFVTLMVGIQNSSNKSEVNFLSTKSIKLPISFIVGISFISGSILGNLLGKDITNQKN